MTDRDRLIIALDLPTTDEANRLVSRLGEDGTFYKIGYQLMPIGGLDLATA
ncbi:MAG: orotidine 5'-phosphate decarboxylase, partial [Parvularculaceae bacterium]|nr:orotidine 5'-phosphate decarboxylase [Parvularculaceae bacterium]